MRIGQKRKRRWGSKGFFGFRPSKIQGIDNLSGDAGSEAANRSGALDGLIERSNSEDTIFKVGTTAKIRRTGSKILSIVRFSGLSSTCIGMIIRRLTEANVSKAPNEVQILLAKMAMPLE